MLISVVDLIESWAQAAARTESWILERLAGWLPPRTVDINEEPIPSDIVSLTIDLVLGRAVLPVKTKDGKVVHARPVDTSGESLKAVEHLKSYFVQSQDVAALCREHNVMPPPAVRKRLSRLERLRLRSQGGRLSPLPPAMPDSDSAIVVVADVHATAGVVRSTEEEGKERAPTVGQETAAIKALAVHLNNIPKKRRADVKRAEAEAWCREQGFAFSRRRFQSRIWPQARELADLPPLAESGRKRKSSR